MGEYITESQYQSWGYTIKWMVSSFIYDDSPAKLSDSNVTLTYNGPVAVEATKENHRKPSHIVASLGEDSSTQINITWLTKYSVTGTDIEILPYSANPEFTGKPTKSNDIEADCELIGKTYFGADLGILGLLPYTRDYAKHTLKISGLEPGTKYSYRIGDAEKGWWSDAGVITTAEGGNESFSFIYITDPQAQRPDHFNRYAQVIETASAEYPDARFVVSAGDNVDEGKNVKHWSYLFNSTDKFLDLPYMPTTGNHEDEEAVITENFMLPNVPEQDLETGVYYSYDYNGVHFTVLNTNDNEDNKLGAEQLEWLKDDISSSDAKWKVVILHKAPYSNGSHYDDGDVEGFRSQLNALLPFLGVDLVLQGHDHVYLRTDVLNANAVIPAKETTVEYDGLEYTMKHDPNGTIYSICGTAGVKIYKTKDIEATDAKFPRAEALHDADNSMFSAITVDGDSLYYNAYEVVDGKAERVDNFAITKTSEAPADKIGSDVISDAIADFLSSVKIDIFWKVINAIADAFAKFMNLFN